MSLSAGDRVGRYEIRALLGAGGMGEVYRARDVELERDVAIKVLREGDGDGGDRGRRFVQEARATSALHHPNVAHVYEIGSHDHFRFIAMELVEGETLRQLLRNGRLPIESLLDISTQIAAALAAAHKHNIVHRDIKPGRAIAEKKKGVRAPSPAHLAVGRIINFSPRCAILPLSKENRDARQ